MIGFIPKAIALLWGFLLTLLPSVVGRVMLALGIGYVTYKGYGLSIDWLFDQLKSNFSGMPSEVVGFLGYIWVDKAISMIFSATSAAMAIRALSANSVTKMVVKGPA